MAQAVTKPAEAEAVEMSVPWHSLDIDTVLSDLGVTVQGGLTQAEAEARLARDGENSLPPPKKRTLLQRFWEQISSVLEVILIVAALIQFGFQQYTNAVFILLVIIINVIVGLIQEGKAEKAASAINNMLAPTATVTRDGENKIIDSVKLVVGDIVSLKAGDRVPADLRVIFSSNLKAQEAALTGEAEACKKKPEKVEVDRPLAERSCMLFSSTVVVYGQGQGVVVEVGNKAEIGKVNKLLNEVTNTITPLIIQLHQFSIWVSVVTIVFSIITLLVAHFARDEPLEEAFTTAIGVAVALIPEGLPAVVTITLAIGVSHMAKHHAIVKQLPAVETLGSVSVICSDKTGTLTKNEMTVTQFCTSTEKFDVTGSGYQPTEGDIMLEGSKTPISSEKREALTRLLLGAAVCNDASVRKDDGQWTVVGAPTEGALVALYLKLSGSENITELRAKNPRVFSIPFQSDYKFMATVQDLTPVGSTKSKRVAFVKGAPDRLIALCSTQGNNNNLWESAPMNAQYWNENVETYSKRGLRVLALCHYELPPGTTEILVDDILSGSARLQMDGLMAIIDPPRDEATQAIKECHSAHITVKMITGDSPITARTIGEMLGIRTPYALTGNELDNMTPEELFKKCMECNIYARVTPEHKLKILQAIQAHGEVCSMTGDGVNDAPALKQASIGVAMGITGTDVAQGAAKMILADDNFASIVCAVKEGRAVYENLIKILAFVLPTNFAQGLSISVAIFIGLDQPLTALQVLYVNLVTSVTFGLVLALELPEDDIMTRRPRRLGQPILSKWLILRTFFAGSIMIIFILINHEWQLDLDSDIVDVDRRRDRARSVAICTLVVCQCLYAYNCRNLRSSSLRFTTIYTNPWISIMVVFNIAILAFLVYTPFINDIFGMGSIGILDWLRCLMFSVVLFIIIEISKVLTRPMVHCLRPILRIIQRSCFCFKCLDKKAQGQTTQEDDLWEITAGEEDYASDYEDDDDVPDGAKTHITTNIDEQPRLGKDFFPPTGVMIFEV